MVFYEVFEVGNECICNGKRGFLEKEARVRGFEVAEMALCRKRSLYMRFFAAARGLSLQRAEPTMTPSTFFHYSDGVSHCSE